MDSINSQNNVYSQVAWAKMRAIQDLNKRARISIDSYAILKAKECIDEFVPNASQKDRNTLLSIARQECCSKCPSKKMDYKEEFAKAREIVKKENPEKTPNDIDMETQMLMAALKRGRESTSHSDINDDGKISIWERAAELLARKKYNIENPNIVPSVCLLLSYTENGLAKEEKEYSIGMGETQTQQPKLKNLFA